MKKILLLMIVAVMLVMALTSCEYVDQLMNLIPEEEGVRYTVTEEEWNNMLEMQNHTLTIIRNVKSISNGETLSMDYDFQIKQNETSGYEKHGASLGSYYVIEGDKSYLLQNIGGDSFRVIESTWKPVRFGVYLERDFVNSLEDLTYDEEKKAYCYHINESTTLFDYEFYFEDGKIVKAIYNFKMDNGGSVNMTINVSNIGTTVIDVPEFTVE